GNRAAMIAQIDPAAGVVRRMRDFLRRGAPHVSTVDAPSMIRDALMLARADAAARHIKIEFDAADDLPPLYGDRIQLQQVILNLIRNAMDALAGAGRSQGMIRIAARPNTMPVGIEIAVLDDGPG